MIERQPKLELSIEEAERVLGAWLGRPVSCSAVSSLKGGMVNSVFGLEFDCPPHQAVIKLHDKNTDTFQAEAKALQHLRQATRCPVPEVYRSDRTGTVVGPAYLLLEKVGGECLKNVELGPDERTRIEIELAALLAHLHAIEGPGFGRPGQVVGSESSDWSAAFVAQVEEVRAQPAIARRLNGDVLAVIDKAIDRAAPSLVDAGPPRLVHGDVWEGNMIVRQVDGNWHIAALLDPDLQYAPAELELAYLEVFDNSHPDFFAAYEERHPRRPGYKRRRLFYWLHTALVHVALFDDDFFRQYTGQIARRIVEEV